MKHRAASRAAADEAQMTLFSFWEQVPTGVAGEVRLVQVKRKLVSALSPKEAGAFLGSTGKPISEERIRRWVTQAGRFGHEGDREGGWWREGPRLIRISARAVQTFLGTMESPS